MIRPTESFGIVRFLSVEQTGRRYHVAARTIYRWSDEGIMPSPIRISGTVRWSIESLEKWEADGFPRVVPLKRAASTPMKKPRRVASDEVSVFPTAATQSVSPVLKPEIHDDTPIPG